MDKTELLSGEYVEINNVIALAKADSEVEQILLSEVSREFGDKLNDKTEQIWYADQIAEIIELAKHNPEKMTIVLTEILKNNEINDLLSNHFQEVTGEIVQ